MTEAKCPGHLDINARRELRAAVGLAMRYWPNAFGGDITSREVIRLSFRFIRNRLAEGLHIQSAIGQLELSAYRYEYV